MLEGDGDLLKGTRALFELHFEFLGDLLDVVFEFLVLRCEHRISLPELIELGRGLLEHRLILLPLLHPRHQHLIKPINLDHHRLNLFLILPNHPTGMLQLHHPPLQHTILIVNLLYHRRGFTCNLL